MRIGRTFVNAIVKVRHEPGAALYVERGGFMLHLARRRFSPPYGDGETWTGCATLRTNYRYRHAKRWL